MTGMGLEMMQWGLLEIKFDRIFLRVCMGLDMRIYERDIIQYGGCSLRRVEGYHKE
jgi:hypothetical protein